MCLQDDIVAASLLDIANVYNVPCQCCVAFLALQLVAHGIVSTHAACAAEVAEAFP